MITTCFNALRSFVFYVLWTLWTIPWCSLIILIVYFFPAHSRHGIFVKTWARVTMLLCRYIIGITVKVEGRENIPEHACVVASNHQSPLETFFLQVLFSPQSTVIKKELFYVPFFGWAFMTLNPIAINRKERRSAMQQVKEKGSKCLKDDYWVLIFPEGTRKPWPEIGKYTRGAVTLAKHAQVPVLPVVHNAGKFWPTDRWLKTPGEVVVRIGQPLDNPDDNSATITKQMRDWAIENNPG